jgi:hypothetical protein
VASKADFVARRELLVQQQEQLGQAIVAMQAQLQQTMNNANAVIGAIQVIDQFIAGEKDAAQSGAGDAAVSQTGIKKLLGIGKAE